MIRLDSIPVISLTQNWSDFLIKKATPPFPTKFDITGYWTFRDWSIFTKLKKSLCIELR